MRQSKDCTSLLTEMRLKWNEGTHKTFVKMREGESVTVPMCVIGTILPLGNSTLARMVEVMVLRHEMECTMWSVAPVSRIQELCLMVECDVV
jgi:hypothetical protein